MAGFASYDEKGGVTAFTPGQSRRGLGQDRRPHGRGVRRRLHVARRTRGRRDRREERPSGPPLAGAPRALRADAGRLVGRRQRGGDGAAAEEGRREPREGEPGRHRAGQPARGGRGRIVPARAPRQLPVRGAARHRAGGQPVARERGRHRRRQGRARPLLGDGARHRAALRGRPARRAARDGVRHHQGGSRRVAHPLPQRLGRQPGGDGGGSGGR